MQKSPPTISSKTPKQWEELVLGAIAELKGVKKATGALAPGFAYAYEPEPIDGAAYYITRPAVTPAPEAGRLVVRFLVVNFEGKLRRFTLEAIVVVNDKLALVPGETRKVGSQDTTTSPFFSAALVPRPVPGEAAGVVSSLGIAALGVGLLAAAVQNKRLTPGADNDASLRLHPHYTNVLINQVLMAVRVAAEGKGLQRVKEVIAGAAGLRDHIQDWRDAKPWPGGTFERTFKSTLGGVKQEETVRLWRPTVVSFLDAQAVVLKFDRVQSGNDDHVLITLMVKPGYVASIIGDVFLSSNNTIFSIQLAARSKTDAVATQWINRARARSVEAGLDGLAFVTGVGEVIEGLVAHINALPAT